MHGRNMVRLLLRNELSPSRFYDLSVYLVFSCFSAATLKVDHSGLSCGISMLAHTVFKTMR